MKSRYGALGEIAETRQASAADFRDPFRFFSEGRYGGTSSTLYRDGSEIQRVMSALHGRMRHRQGFTRAQLEREADILAEELEALILQEVPEGVGDVSAALEVLRHLLDQGTVVAVQAYRQAVQASGD